MKRSRLLIPLLLCVAGCAYTSFQADPVPPALRASGQSYFVQNHGSDDRHLERMIATEVEKHGLSATSGYAADRPQDVDVLVLYEDRWVWDLSNYLIFMRIDLRDPNTNVLLATGSSYQTSMARKDEQKVIAAIVAGMFK